MTVHLPAAGSFDPVPTVAALAAHAVPGLERVDVAQQSVTRLLDLGGGPVPVTVRLDRTGAAVDVPAGATAREVRALTDLVRWWFDLDVDPGEALVGLGHDPLVGPLVRRRPGLRLLRHPEGFAAAVGIVVGQQVSVAAARTVLGRLVAAFGAPGPAPGLRAFPTAVGLAEVGEEDLRATIGVTTRRAATIRAVAYAVADGLAIGPDADPAEVRRRLRGIAGVGPWTVETVALRALGDDDAFPAGDLVLRRALGAATTTQAEAVAARWSPWRGRVAGHLWADLVYGVSAR